MQLVGANRGFIRRPFLFRGVLQGIYASLLAIAMLTGLVYLIQDEFSGIISLDDYRILGMLFGMVILVGAVISWFSTLMAVNRYLKIKVDKLYY
jgi:cell division transport system permease protein